MSSAVSDLGVRGVVHLPAPGYLLFSTSRLVSHRAKPEVNQDWDRYFGPSCIRTRGRRPVYIPFDRCRPALVMAITRQCHDQVRSGLGRTRNSTRMVPPPVFWGQQRRTARSEDALTMALGGQRERASPVPARKQQRSNDDDEFPTVLGQRDREAGVAKYPVTMTRRGPSQF